MTGFSVNRADQVVGVIGGMGPLATVDFMQQLIEHTPVLSDQDHIAAVVAQIPHIPDRVGAILRGTESPLPALLASLQRLERATVDVMVMPCNTAHFWYDDLAAASHVPFLHIVDAVVDELLSHGVAANSPVGLLATPATLVSGVYPARVTGKSAYQFVAPDEDEVQSLLVPAILMVKQGRVNEAGALVQECAHQLRVRGIEHVVLGCTELPIALKAVGVSLGDGAYVDSTVALAKATVRTVRAIRPL